jgi:hypothetical protein
MTSHEFGMPSSPKERLAAAKAAFRTSVLQNDTLFSVLQARLGEPTSIDAGLPDFGLEPTLRRNDDGTSTIGLRINRSATPKGGVINVFVGVYDYLPLGHMDRTTGDTKVTPEFKAALTAAGKEKADALGVLQAWQAGVNEMGAQFPEPLMLDPMTDTFELQEELMVHNYVAIDPEK